MTARVNRYSARMSAQPLAPVEIGRAAEAFVLPGQGLYLDCAAHAPPLHAAVAAAHAALETAPWTRRYDAWEADLERLRTLAGDVLFGGDGDGVACVPSAAHGLATAARNLALARGDAVLVLDGQFPSDLLAWQQRCADTGARIVVARRDADETWTACVLRTLHQAPQVRIASLCQAHWHDGRLLDLDVIATELRARSVALVLDLSQSLGVLAVDLRRWQPAFVVAVGYKWLLGATGLAWLWASPRWRDAGIALEQHWLARDPEQVWRMHADTPPRYRTGARRFDAGVVADPIRLAMAEAGLLQLRTWGVPAIADRLGTLTRALDMALDARGLGDWIMPGHAPHITALQPPTGQREAVARALRGAGVLCTQRADGRLRIAPHLHVDAATMTEVVGIATSAARTR